jgi:hypothetical protein
VQGVIAAVKTTTKIECRPPRSADDSGTPLEAGKEEEAEHGLNSAAAPTQQEDQDEACTETRQTGPNKAAQTEVRTSVPPR